VIWGGAGRRPLQRALEQVLIVGSMDDVKETVTESMIQWESKLLNMKRYLRNALFERNTY
jgi:hypothetical protein